VVVKEEKKGTAKRVSKKRDTPGGSPCQRNLVREWVRTTGQVWAFPNKGGDVTSNVPKSEPGVSSKDAIIRR